MWLSDWLVPKSYFEQCRKPRHGYRKRSFSSCQKKLTLIRKSQRHMVKDFTTKHTILLGILSTVILHGLRYLFPLQLIRPNLGALRPVYTERLRLRLPLAPMMDENAFYIKLYRKTQTQQAIMLNSRFFLGTQELRDTQRPLHPRRRRDPQESVTCSSPTSSSSVITCPQSSSRWRCARPTRTTGTQSLRRRETCTCGSTWR